MLLRILLFIQLPYCGSSLKATFIMPLSFIRTSVVYHCSDKLLSENYIIITHYRLQDKVQIPKHNIQKALHTLILLSLIFLPNHPRAIFQSHSTTLSFLSIPCLCSFASIAASLLFPLRKFLIFQGPA